MKKIYRFLFQKYTPERIPESFLVFLILLLIVFQVLSFSEPLWEQDEAAYAGFGLHYFIYENYLEAPQFPLSEPHRKPPLLFFVIKLSYELFGISEISVRLVNLLVSLLIFFTFPFLLRYYAPELTGKERLFGVLIFFSFLIIAVYGRIALTDYLLLYFQLLFLFVNYFWLTEKKTTKKILYGFLLFFILVAGSFVKGPVIFLNFVLTGAFFVFFLFLKEKSWKASRKFGEVMFLFFLSLVPVSLWFFWLYHNSQKEFVLWFLDWYILKRTHASVFGQTAPPGAYFVFLFVFTFPWSVAIFKVLFRSFRFFLKKILFFLKKKRVAVSGRILYEIASFFSLYFVYEFLPSKLPSYILAFYILLSLWLIRYFRKKILTPANVALRVLILAGFLQAVLFFTEDYRTSSRMWGMYLKEYCEKKTIYISEAIRLPGIIWYYLKSQDTPFLKEAYENIKTLSQLYRDGFRKDSCLLLTEKERKNIEEPGITGRLQEKETWIPDKGKKENLLLLY